MRNSNMPAMPILGDRGERLDNSAGLTKREYLAGLAMEGVLSDSHLMQLIREASEEETHTPKFVAGLAVEYAGALLAELAK